MLLTTNVILEKISDGIPTYSVFYGECFGHLKEEGLNEDDDRGLVPKPAKQESTQVGDRFSARTITEFRSKFPDKIDLYDAATKFQHGMDDSSGVTIHSIVNIVVLYFKVLDSSNARRKRMKDQTLNLPRVMSDG